MIQTNKKRASLNTKTLKGSQNFPAAEEPRAKTFAIADDCNEILQRIQICKTNFSIIFFT